MIIQWQKIIQITDEKIGENYNQEIYYDFKEIVEKIPIQPTDALIETFLGPFDLYQKISKNIFTISIFTNSGEGTKIPKEEAEKVFFETIGKYHHGWYLTSYYLFEKWPCEDYVTCSIRDFVKKNKNIFKLHPYSKDPNLFLYEWQK